MGEMAWHGLECCGIAFAPVAAPTMDGVGGWGWVGLGGVGSGGVGWGAMSSRMVARLMVVMRALSAGSARSLPRERFTDHIFITAQGNNVGWHRYRGRRFGRSP